MIDLESVFGEPAAPAASILTPPATAAPGADHSNGPEGIDAPAGGLPGDILAGCRATDARWESGPDPGNGPEDAPDLDADGWPVGSIEPQDCPTCPGLLTWQDVAGRWRCETCDADALARSQRLADAAARSRQRWPAESAPRTAPGRGPAALPDSQHPDSRRPQERPLGGFAGAEG